MVLTVLPAGQTYDRSALNKWFERHQPPTDPKTNVVLADTKVVPNWALREALIEWHESQGTDVILEPPAEQVQKSAHSVNHQCV